MHGLGYSLKVPRQNVHSNIQDKDFIMTWSKSQKYCNHLLRQLNVAETEIKKLIHNWDITHFIAIFTIP